MKRGPKIALVTVVALLLVIGGALLYVGTQLDAIVARLIAKHGSAATRTEVRVSGVEIRLADARGEISGLTIANPEGFGGGPAIELGNFVIRIDPQSVTTDTVVLNEVTVSGARFNMVQQGGANNLRRLLDNLGAGAPAEQPPEDAGSAKKIVIERFALEDARASVSIPDLDEDREVTVPTIVLNDIGRATNGATAASAARQVLTPVIRRTLESAAAQTLQDKAREQLDEAKDRVLNGVMDRLGDEDGDDTP